MFFPAISKAEIIYEFINHERNVTNYELRIIFEKLLLIIT